MTRKAIGRCLPLVAGILVLSACSSSPGSREDGCRDVDDAVTDQAMSLTKSNFTTPDGGVIDRVKFVDAAAVALPTAQQRFGAQSILALRVTVFFGGEAAGSSVSGADGEIYLALDADDRPIAPVGAFSEPFFDLEPPADPGWSSWSKQVDASDASLDASGCVNPDL